MADAGPLSYRCANLLAKRMAWDQQLLDLGFDDAHQVGFFLQRIETPDPFDTDLMSAWSEAAQTESLWYARSLDFIFNQRPLHEFADFASQHTCLPLPNDAAFLKRLLVQFTQAGIGVPTFLQDCVEQQLAAPDDVDWLYLLACQSSLLGRTIRHCRAGSGCGTSIAIRWLKVVCWKCAPSASRLFCRY
jgi:hypothetical protein